MSYQDFPVHLVGGRICLDFLNTANWTEDGTVGVERLTSVADLDTWIKAADLQCRGATSQQELEGTILQFRASLRRVILSAVQNTNPRMVDIALINAAAQLPGNQAPLEIAQDGFAVAASSPLAYGLALSAIAMLTDEREISRVKMCPGSGCGWMFLDESANGRRQWCSMEMCGNREKARRHYARNRKP